MKLRPLYDKVVVKALPQQDKTQGGIIIPDTAKEKPVRGKVVAVGQGIRGDDGNIHPLQLKVGDEVLYGKWGSTEVTIDGEELLIMKESDVMCVVSS